MSQLKGACLIGQSGGPTSVINASALGCIEAALKSESVTRVYGAAHGIRGVLDDCLYDMNQEDPKELALMKSTPSSVLGTCRYKLKDFNVDDSDYKRILEIFKKYNIRYFFYNGGNDSMDTCNKISQFMAKNDYEIRVMGIPKTIDNDLALTDHCPGYGSAAKYIATSCMEIYRDAKVYGTGSITVLEIMGRNAGWLTAASAIATYKGMGPDLIYLPEIPFQLDTFIADITKVYEEKGDVLVAVSEGIVDENGRYISEILSENQKAKDAFGHVQMGGLASTLANYANSKINAKVRGIEFGIIQRCAAHISSETDANEAYMAGEAAFQAAEAGETDKMVAFERGAGPEYVCKTVLVDLSDVANFEKKVPREWVNEAGNGLLQPFIDYAMPLIQGENKVPMEDGVPKFANLKKISTCNK
ncbi:MAG: 6-phosphofructokinase [Eubacteriales bacterium]|nr:6-phosphofructokinase [Eubacteriales bacterium]